MSARAKTPNAAAVGERLPYLLSKLKAPRVLERLEATAARAREEQWPYEQFLEALLTKKLHIGRLRVVRPPLDKEDRVLVLKPNLACERCQCDGLAAARLPMEDDRRLLKSLGGEGTVDDVS
jgi:hypothetical protein